MSKKAVYDYKKNSESEDKGCKGSECSPQSEEKDCKSCHKHETYKQQPANDAGSKSCKCGCGCN